MFDMTIRRAASRNKKTAGGVLRIGVFALTLLCTTAALAQEDATFDNEFEAFQKKVDAARGGVEDESQESFLEDTAETPPPPANPLGPAATLPLGNQPFPALNAAVPTTVEGMQMQIEAEEEAARLRVQQEVFDAAIKQLLPLSPEQVREVYARFKVSREAAETPIQVPEVKTQVQSITLDPGQSAPVIRMVPGYVTTLSILDSSGAPWPIQDLTFAGKFDVTPPETGGNIIRMTPQSAHGVGNMSMRLVDLITPVIFTLQTSMDTVDYRIDARITRPGPLAKPPIIEYGGLNTVAGTDSNLVSILDGTMPSGARKLQMTGVDGRTSAWRMDGRIYLRTPLTLLSPAWDSSVASADGTTVYTLNDSPVILLSDGGRMVRAQVAADEVTQ